MAKSKGKRKRRATDSSQSKSAKRAKLGAPQTESQIPETITSFTRFPERPDNDDRNKEAVLYDYLGDEDGEIRNAAALAITRGLLGATGEEPVSDVELQRHLDRRLFRGLASGRNASRIGFSIVLTEVLSRLFGAAALADTKYKRFTFAKALSTLCDNSPLGKATSKSVETNYYLGQLFGLECFVKAKVIAQDSDRWTQLLTRLLEVGTKKVSLRSPSGWIIVQAVDQLSKSQAEETLEALRTKNLAKTQEGLAVWLAVMERFPEVKKEPWKQPFATKTLPALGMTLRDGISATADEEESSVSVASSWAPQLHFVWDLIVKHFADIGDAGIEEFSSFWQKVVEDGFFSNKASPQRKFRGFLVFSKMVEGLAHHPSMITTLFSSSFLSCLMNQAAKKDRYLHNAALKTLSSIDSAAEKHPETVVPILRGLLGPNAMYGFDMRTKSKTVAKVLQCTRDEDAEAVLKLLRVPLKKAKGLDAEKRESLAAEYVKYLHKLAVAEPRTSADAGTGRPLVAGSALDQLCSLAYAKPKLMSKYGMSSKTKELCRVHLEPAFAKAISSPGGYHHLCSAVVSIGAVAVEMDAEVQAKRDKALEAMQSLSSDKFTESAARVSHALALLYAVVLFQLYNEDADAVERLSDLEEFQRRFEKEKTDEAATTFLVEALLSMVPHKSPLIRQASRQIFEALAPHLSYEALALLVEPLSAPENLDGHKQLFAGEDEMDEEESEEGSEDGSGEESESDSDAEIDDEMLPDADAEQKAFEENLARVLRTHRLDEDADAPSETESDMTDSEMMAIDGQLASAFKGREAALPPNKKDKQNAKEAVIHFKHRVLDLVAAYLSAEGKSAVNAFRLLPDVVRLAATTSSPGLVGRVGEVILAYKSHFNKKEKENWGSSSTDEEELAKTLVTLQQLHDEVVEQRAESQAFARTASTACLILLSALYAKEPREKSMEKARDIYRSTEGRGSKVHRSFFDGFKNWCQSMGMKG